MMLMLTHPAQHPGQPARDEKLLPMRIADVLFTQGFGSRRECAALLDAGFVQVQGRVLRDPSETLETTGLMFNVQGREWPFHATAVVMLHKPAGFECSRAPRHHPSVLSLLPVPLQRRGLQPVGRLDEDTTGLLLLTDSGALIHRLTSPKWHATKVYEVTAKHPVSDADLAQLCAGVVLHDDPAPVRAAATQRISDTRFSLSLTEGKYHQVKRMVAAMGNRCEALHRSAFGPVVLPADLPVGGWRWVTELGV
jgi:16S rRNA pseudouridine516 synthase